ncbi:E3 ubiquitin-protein ligase TRIM71-like [Saccostrea cucullata]|uniref:E3 ubiquitin-protein ligase TRIM71-like n=1 Tax=Saccostrea cuccullata TaxID=36930 RepID=UPI002ED0E5B7
MATGGQDSCVYGSDVEKYTKCPCCSKNYVDPWFLQCGHTMNLRCIRRQQPIVKCSVCDETFLQATSRIAINRFAKDISLKVAYREITNLLLTNPACSLSEHTDKDAVSYCERCSMRMCHNCNQFHSMNPSTKRHKTYEVSEMIDRKCHEEDINVDPQSPCEYHDHEIIKNWCLDCKIPSCNECCSGHHLESLSKHVIRAENEIRIIKEKLERGLTAIQIDLEVVKQNKKIIKQGGHLKGEIASEMEWSKQKCKLVIKIYDVLLREVSLLQKKGNEFHKCYTLPFFSFQTKRIQESTNSIPSCSRSLVSHL